MAFKRILVAVNSPNGRDAAFERALALARSAGAELYVLYAVPVNQAFSSGGADRLERMSDMRKRADDAGVSVQTVEQHGDAAEIIELHADAREADLIVLGGEARRGWGRSRSRVAETVIRRTKVPTLVVPSDGPDTSTAFENVLVAVDLSPASEDVLRGALGLTAREAVQVTVVHSVNGLEAADAVQSPARWKVPEFRTHVLDDARRSLEGLVSEVPTGVDTRVHVSAGSAARTILDQAADLDADLVVVGRSRGFKLLGSTALRVLRKNDRALLVIPSVDAMARRPPRPLLVLPKRARTQRDESAPRRILTPIDFSVASDVALKTAVELARRHGARLTLLHTLNDVTRHMTFSGGGAWEVMRQLPAQKEAAAERLRRNASFFGLDDVDTEVATGLLDSAILESARRGNPDLIVMGSSRRSWPERGQFGSTLRRVLRRATVPVLVVPVIADAHALPIEELVDQLDSRVWSDSGNGRIAA